MSNILKRKMFKLGGEVSKSHGVGLTHGLKFNKGGSVTPQATYGVGNNANKMIGPDNKVREAHSIMKPIFSGIGQAIGFPALKAIFQGAKSGTTKPIVNFVKGTSGPVKGKFGSTRELLTGDPRLRYQLLRGAQVAAPGGGLAALAPGLTMAALDRAGITEKSDKDSALEKYARDFGKFGLDYSIPGALLKVSGALTETEDNKKQKSLFNLLSGNKEKEAITFDGKENTKKEEKDMSDMQSEAQARMAEYYKLLGGGQTNKMMQASKALLAAAPLVSDGDYARAMSAAGGELIGAQEQDQKIAQEAALMTIQEMRQEEAAKQETINQIMLNNGIDSAVEAERVYEAMEKTGSASNVKQLPLKTNGKQDTELTQPGVVYTDVTNISGSLFVVYNSAEEPLRTNDYQAALAHAKE